MRLAFLFVATAAIAGLVAAACGGSGSKYDDLSPKELLDRVEERMTRQGQVLHVESRFVSPEDESIFQDNELWAWFQASEARLTSDLHRPSNVETIELANVIVSGDSLYKGPEGGTIPAKRLPYSPCLGTGGSALVELVACSALGSAYLLDNTPGDMTVESGFEFEGIDAIAILIIIAPDPEGTSNGGPDTVEFRFVLDADSLNPLAFVVTAKRLPSDEVIEAVTRYTTEFVPRDSLPDDFFDPASIGYEGSE
jgi:hypothetical protein